MDERHWWIAGKIQESFRIGGYDNPTLLEDFMCEESTLAKVNKFLRAGGPCRLFFYCQKPESGAISTCELHVTGNLATLKDVDLDKVTVLYFLRNRTDKDVDPNRMERDIFCGELKHNTIEALSSLLSDIYIPITRAQKDWGHCNEEGQTHLMQSMDKFVIALNETAASMRHSRQWMLRQPENVVLNDFKQQRAAALDPQLIGQYEELVNEWINTIEAILNDTSDERFMDPNAGPMSELERWRRRQRLLTSVTEQLKGKECKAVIAVLIQAKSRLLKKWKATDAALTDGLNDTKDKLKYLESLKRHFDQLYHDASPHSIINSAIPGLTNTIKQMDAISRYYARSGFLGIILTKVTNQLVMACKDHIKSCTTNVIEDRDELWDCVAQEALMRDPAATGDTQQKLLKSQVESKLKQSSRGKAKEGKDIGIAEDGLFNRLRACLMLQGFFREALRSLRDSLGGSQNLSHYSSVSSFAQAMPPGSKNRTARGVSGTSRQTGGVMSPSKRSDPTGHGVPITDEDAIMSHMDIFCSRIRQLLEVINTMAQYNKLTKSLVGIPRPRKEDLVIDDGSEQDEYAKFRKPKEIDLLDNDDDPLVTVTMPSPDRSLRAIAEEDSKEDDADGPESKGELEEATSHAKQGDEIFEVVKDKLGLTEDDLALLRKYYPEEDEGPNLTTIVEEHVQHMNTCMRSNVTTKTMLDVESKDRDRFEHHYTAFQEVVRELEAFLAAYLHAIFVRKMKTQHGLDAITKFAPIQNRHGIRGTIAEKYVELFNWYEGDLEEVHQIYERHKEKPQMVRNAPPVAGAIYWSRQLLKRIEDPMKIFRDNKAVTQLTDFGRIVRIYNRLATALVTFESLWFTQWKNRIEQARAGLRATLFVHHPVTREIVVNADERVLELIHEAKWLTRLDIAIPESAQSVLQQEGRFKKYRAHLELVLSEYRQVCQQVPGPLQPLFQPHITHVHQQLQPGLSTLAWNSMNIDAFLHQIHTATSKLKRLGEQVAHLMETKVSGVISTISNFCLYDLQLAFSKTWPPNEFRDMMMESIEERSEQLKDYVTTIIEGLQNVANLLSTRKTEAGKLKDKKMTLIVDDEEVERERQLAHREEEMVMDLISHYKDQVYEAVLTCTSRSLAALSEAAGCQGEVVRALSPLSPHHDAYSQTISDHGLDSEASSPSPRGESRMDSARSQLVMSLHSERPESNISNLSDATWSLEHRPLEPTYLQFEVQIRFNIPTIMVEPSLDVVQKVMLDVTNAVLEATSEIVWLSREGEESFFIRVSGDGNVQELQSQLSSVIEELSGYVQRHLFHFSYYNFLWKDDMHGNFHEFIVADPGNLAIKREVERYLYIEKKVLGIPSRLPVGPICLYTDPIKDALHGFSMAWKTTFASVLHEEAKKKLDAAVAYRSNVKGRLEQHVQTLDELNSALHLLEELRDMENKIDNVYLPIETMYAKLREFELRLPREEVETVDQLRAQWTDLLELAEQVRVILLKERRGAFEQELDKQVKTFVVEVIQFRNAFDAQGPSVPGIQPAEAVSRLQDFQMRYQIYDTKRKTLDSVSKLFGIACKPFPELDRTGEELDLLSQLYGLFQKFIRFDTRFRDTLWAEVDLEGSSHEVESYWDECLALPSKLKDWDAYNDLKTKLQNYLEVFPLLQNLASKEIRNRHWLQVMQVTNSSFQLEANVFKLSHLLDIGLIKHKLEIEEICRGASQELELEIKMRVTEEEWTEQVLNFEHYKRRGPMYLDKAFTQRLLEQLEDAEALLAVMLTSKYIGPLRDEAASWAEKLKEVAEVLELWLEVQDLWQYLEAVFSNSVAVRELPQEAKRFARIDKGWTKMMKRAFDTRNVLQCCYGGEVPKAVVLRHIHEELEICFKSLMGYLDNKRRAFPRFYFVSDPILLALLSRPNDLESLRPHLRSLFMQIHDVKLEKSHEPEMDDSMSDDIRDVPYARHSRTPAGLSPHDRRGTSSGMSSGLQPRSTTPPKIDKRLHQHFNWKPKNMNPQLLQSGPTMLPSEGLVDDVNLMDATAVLSSDGEVLPLLEKVGLVDGVEVWVEKLRDSVGHTLQDLNISVVSDCNSSVPMDEWAFKYPSQVCRLGMLYHWTRECEQGITEIRYDRKALHGLVKKYQANTARLSSVLVRGVWRTIDEPMLPVHKARLECMITQSMYLRDVIDNICSRKLREVTDFEWRRSVRCYMHPSEEKPSEPMVWILDTAYSYGSEFYGTDCGVALTPITERCFLTMSLALNQCMGAHITGPVGVGKTETIRGLANIFGHFMGVFQCSEVFSPVNIGKICQGMSMDGCWGCFDEGQTLSRESMSVLMDHVQSIILALRAKQNYMYLVDGTEIPMKKTVGLFMTTDPTHNLPRVNFPNDIAGSFRTISLIKPDLGQILKAKCSALGFRAPNVLALRLKVLSELVRDQLPFEYHHHFSVSALNGVLKRASQKRRSMRDDKLAEKEKREETSRSESANSEAPTTRLMSHGGSMGGVKLPGQMGMRKSSTPNPMTAGGKQEHAIVAQTIEDIIGPRLTGENLTLFKTILKDCFLSLPDAPAGIMSAKLRSFDMESAIENKAKDLGLIAHKPWVARCMQLYNLSQVHHGIIIAGKSGSGKSTCVQTVVEALCLQARGLASRQSHASKASTTAENMHKLQRIYPMMVDDLSLMFGSLDNNGDWVDGIVTSAIRKSNRNQSTTWLCLDGPLTPVWADNFNSVLSSDKVLHQLNGDKLFLSDNIMVLFETDKLSEASPATVARSGIVHLDQDTVGWKPIARAWLESRTHQEVHWDVDAQWDKSIEGVLQRAFQKTLDPITQFVMHEARPRLKLSEVGMFRTCLGLLSAMLADNIEIGGELHIERLYLFCLIWTFGGLLDATDRKGFSDVLKTLSTALPDDDRDICVFDYYVDESGEWDPWHSRVPEVSYTDSQDILGEVFIDTIDTIRSRILMEFAAASGQNVLLVGPHGSGKTALVNTFIDAQDPQTSICKRLVFSGASTASQLQQFVESNIYHRQGFVYGAKENKKLKVFIDDINLPVGGSHGIQRCNELLRQLLDDRVVCTLEKPFESHIIEGLTIFSAMALTDYPSMSNRVLSERLLRHFAVFSVPPAHDEPLKSVVHGILEANMTQQESPGLDLDLHNALVNMSRDMLTAAQNVLRPTPMPGRCHYLFTLKDISKCFQCLKRLADESKADEGTVIALWRHEITRIMRDRLSRFTDLLWFDDKLDQTLAQHWSKLEEKMPEHFVTFPMDTRIYQRPITTHGTKQIKVMLQPVENLGDLHTCLSAHLTRYNEEFGNVRLDIMLSDFTISHVVRMHRILSFHHGGNMLLIGAVGCHLARLCRLALHVADIPIHKMDASKQSNFFDGLRSAIRLSGSEGKIITLLFTSRDLNDEVYLDAINSLLISGEYPHLFSNDEMDGLLQAIHPAMKREFPSSSMDPMKFFVSRVKSNLHIIVCLQPSHPLLRDAYNKYPGLLSGCQINWLCDWPQEALLGEASYFIAKHQLTQEFEDLRDSITTCLANIHSFVLRDCKQLPWAGDLNPETTLSTVKAHDKKKDQLKVQTVKVPNLPYSKTILYERIKQRHRNSSVAAKNEVYVGPTTFRRFMDSFQHLYTSKAQERTDSVEQLKKVLATLDKTRADAKVMKKAIKTITGNFEDACQKTADLLQRLTNKATSLEKLKAKVGLSKSLDAYLHLTEFESEEEEEDELLKEEEYDDYDKEFDKMREATLKTRQVQAKEEYADTKHKVDVCRQQLEHARTQVLVWKGKVDRQCVERLKAFQTPPVLVGQVMEMVMILIGKRLPSQRIQEVREYPTGKEDLSSRMSSSSSSTKLIIKKTKTTKDGERFDRAQWKSMTVTMNDSTKFVDMLHNVSWADGLPTDVLQAVESYLAVSKEGQLGVTGEGSMLENASEKTFQAIKRSASPQGRANGITISAAKYSSEDCATLVQYTIAIVEYTRRCGPLKAAMERMHELEREIEENERMQKLAEEEAKLREKMRPKEEKEKPAQEEPDEELSEADLPRLQSEVNQLQQDFDLAVVDKHSLQMELQSMNERLKAATEMVESMKDQEAGWRQHVKDNGSNELLIANCLTAAGFLTYAGAVNVDTRLRMGEFFMQVCEHHGLPLHKKLLFRNMELIEFLYTPIDIMKLEMMRLPTTRLMLENSCFLMQEASITAWPLVCDPTSRVLTWLKGLYENREMVVVKYHEMRSQLENCLADGTPLLVTDCEVNQLVSDLRFVDTIQSCVSFIKGKSRFKVIVTDHEVECDPRFRLFLHTTVEPQAVPQQLAAYTSVLFFQQSRNCVEEELLDTFMAHEKARLENESSALRQEKEENMLQLDKLERLMREQLSSDVRLMNDLQATRRMAELKKQYDETQENLGRIAHGENSIQKAREGFRAIAQRAAVCFDTTQYMREINPVYQSSFSQFLSIFEAAISHSDRSAVKALIDKLTYSAYTTTARSLMERDRLVYSLLLAIEVEESQKNIGPGEREFLVSPNYSSVVMSALGYIQPPDSRIVQAKKPFDWMTDDQFHNLQVLATHFEWFQEMFDRMPKDGRETQWRNLCESDTPELQPLPDKMDDVYKPMQRLCVVRAIRSDRLIHAAHMFINSVLGKKYAGDLAPDFATLLRQSSPLTPIIMLFDSEDDTCVKLFTDYANRKQNCHVEIYLTDNGMAPERVVRKQIQKGMAEGQWVLLHNAHNCPHLLNAVETVLAECAPPNLSPEHTFRLWISSKVVPEVLPVRLLQNSVKVVISSPKVMKDSLCRSMSWMEPDILKQSNRPEWPAMLHNLCYLHATIQLRARFGQGGWNCPEDFGNISFRELLEAVGFTVGEFKDPLSVIGSDGTPNSRVTSWTGIRYILSEVVYGSYVTDPGDQQSLSAMVDYWVSPTAIKKEFEVARLKYKLPAVFFNPSVRLNTLVQALDGINPLFLDVPEGCHLHPNVETLLGDDQYIFTRLNKIFDVMPSTPTLSHKLFPRPPTPFIGPPLAGVSSQSNNPSVVEQGVFSTASYATYKMRKDVELWEICYNMLQRVPKAYNKEYIIEKVKKIGGFTSFNNFIIKELEIMYGLLNEIKTSLTAIKTATESNLLGDQMSEHTLSVADDLYHLRIPQLWCNMSGYSAPPLTWGLGQWLTELQSRCHHFERILSLGREKMPAYWLGAFFNPRGLLALQKQESIRSFAGDRSGNFEHFVFQTEVTSRDKDHLRDPPQEGMFVFGIHVWGCAWEKTTGELQDTPPRTGCAALPVVHLTCWPASDKPSGQDSTRASETYQCPVYHSRIAPREVVMELDVRREGIPSTRWALRGLSATIRPY